MRNLANPFGDAVDTVWNNINFSSEIDDGVRWMRDHWTAFFGALKSAIEFCVDKVEFALTDPSPLAIIILFTLIAWWARNWKFALFTAVAFVLVHGMVVRGDSLWQPTMESLSLVIVAGVVALAISIPLGILSARNRAVSTALRPILDFFQTLPVFVYLIPAVAFFGVGVSAGMVATTIFAMAPGVRFTELGIRQVDREVVEASIAFGAKPRQVLREVQVPLAMPTVMGGVNQVIMLSLSMVVISGMVGAGGLGSVVVTAIGQLKIGNGFMGGLAVVFLAIFLDRLVHSFATDPAEKRRGGKFRYVRALFGAKTTTSARPMVTREGEEKALGTGSERPDETSDTWEIPESGDIAKEKING